MSRTQNAIKNSFFGVTGKVLGLLCSFISRTVFIYALGNTYLGISGLYSEILSVLSLATLGFGTALSFSLYKPVADNDEKKIILLLEYYKRIYKIIVLVITIIGLLIIPFLPYIVKGADFITIKELRLYYVFYLINTVVSYLMAYKESYVNALQKNYLSTNVDTLTTIATSLVQIFIIIRFRSFLAYLIVQSMMLICSRFLFSIYLNRKFEIFRIKKKSDEKLGKNEINTIHKEVKALAIHQFSSVAVHSTDNIIISSVSGMGVQAVGLISNYTLLINSVIGFVVIIFNSVISGFGNLVASSSTKQFKKVFGEINFINFWMYGFCSIAFFVLIPPFIELWIGKNNLINEVAFFLIVLNCYLQGQCTIYNNARIAKGDFAKDKWLSLLQALINLIVSIIGARYLGLVGVYIGTIVSRLFFFICRPLCTYGFLFNESVLHYYLVSLKYLLSIVVIGGLTKVLCISLFKDVSIISFAFQVIIVLIVPNIMLFILYAKDKVFVSIQRRIKGLVRR